VEYTEYLEQCFAPKPKAVVANKSTIPPADRGKSKRKERPAGVKVSNDWRGSSPGFAKLAEKYNWGSTSAVKPSANQNAGGSPVYKYSSIDD